MEAPQNDQPTPAYAASRYQQKRTPIRDAIADAIRANPLVLFVALSALSGVVFAIVQAFIGK